MSGREELKRENTEIQRHLDDVNKRLRDFESVQELQRLYDQYTRDIEFAQQGLEKAVRAIRDSVSGSYVRFSSPSIDAALAILEEKRQTR